MKILLFFLIIMFVITGCGKEKYGNMKQKIKVTTESMDLQSNKLKNGQELRYNQFGDFITSITPTSFIGEFSTVRFQSTNDSSMMTLIHVNWEDPRVQADFSSNSILSVIPILNGDMITSADGQGCFYKNDVTFDLLWIGMGIKQTIELPLEYADINLKQFEGQSEYANKQGNILTTGLLPLNQKVANLSFFGNEIHFYFGRTDSTYINYGSMIGNAEGYNIRSSKFNTWTMKPPKANETKIITSTIGFNNDNIIQLYAGADNIPYTTDDIIVLEPNFWERLQVYVDEKIE